MNLRNAKIERQIAKIDRHIARAGRETAKRGGHGGCAVCNHEQGRVIDEALIAGVPLRLLAATYGMSIAALSRHHKHHVTHRTVEQRVVGLLDRLLAKCDEFTKRALEQEPDDEVLGVIDDLRQEVLELKTSSRLWST